jgi:6-pyruvoyltetrahydropterin/6-carboxytetrahydropterin synthase
LFIDYSEIDDSWAPLFERIDHHYLIEVEGLENPTSEVLCHWLFTHLSPKLPSLSKIIVHETCNASCEYDGN